MGMFNQLTDNCQLVSNGNIEFYVIDKMDEVKAEMLRLLTIIDKISRERGIKYWVDGGTLIGAVRHKGFIPWDDDIDIALLKPDYNALIKALEEGKYSNEINEFLWYSGDTKNDHCCNYLCSKLKIYGRMKGSYGFVPIKLDIRPVNIISNNKESLELNSELREIANEWIFNKKVKKLTEKSVLFQKMTKREFFHFYNEKYGFETDENSILALPYYEFAQDGFLPRDIFEEIIECPFENITTSLPVKYDEYLKMLYGDYMRLPAVESRVPAFYEYFYSNIAPEELIQFFKEGNKGILKRIENFLKMYGPKVFLKILREKISREYRKQI